MPPNIKAQSLIKLFKKKMDTWDIYFITISLVSLGGALLVFYLILL